MSEPLQTKVEQTLNQLISKISQLSYQEKIISLLQFHSSYACQSEELQDYANETQQLIEQCFAHNNERLFDRLNDQLELLAKCAINQKIEDISNKSNYASRLGQMHKKLAEYRQYLTKFDDQIRLNPTLPDNHQLRVRRQRCLDAIEKLETQISRFEQKRNFY
ncbi:primosomal replication protein PriC [Catenovulum sp. SX2]|uniref:primosomal replication protein PriC n=1 Tax=Catenovulum sp. SX2 TaxID=3398614 RepID=UPI003F840814